VFDPLSQVGWLLPMRENRRDDFHFVYRSSEYMVMLNRSWSLETFGPFDRHRDLARVLLIRVCEKSPDGDTTYTTPRREQWR
jgi:hypothetical protein